MCRRVRRVNFVVPAFADTVLADQRNRQPIGVVHVVQPEAALHTKALFIGRTVAAIDLDDLVVFQVIRDLTADTTERTDAVYGLVGGADAHASFINHSGGQQCAGRTGLHAFPAGHACGLAHRVIEIEDNFRIRPPHGHPDHIVGLHFPAGTDTQVAVNAGVEVHRHCGMAHIGGWGVAAREPASGHGGAIGPLPEFGITVMRRGTIGLVGNEQFEHHLARFRGAFGLGVDHHALGWLAQAGRGQHALALHMDHAGAAIAVGPVTGLGRIAKMWDIHAFTRGDLPDGFIGRGLDLVAVEGEGDAFAHDGNSVPCGGHGCPVSKQPKVVIRGLDPRISSRFELRCPGQARA